MNERLTCSRCKINLRAINYKKNDRVYYRSQCDPCITLQSKEKTPRWMQLGYKKKSKCEACGFIPKFKEQITVYEKTDRVFKSICLNCDAVVKITNHLDIKKGDLEPDF
jgi:hypothetical protein